MAPTCRPALIVDTRKSLYIRCSFSFLPLLRSLSLATCFLLSTFPATFSLSLSPLPVFLPGYLSIPFSTSCSLFLTIADPKAGERAGRYVHFYALIYAHAFTKNNPVSKTEHNERSPPVAERILPRLIPFHASTRSTEVPFLFRTAFSAFYFDLRAKKHESTYTGSMQMRSLEPRRIYCIIIEERLTYSER